MKKKSKEKKVEEIGKEAYSTLIKWANSAPKVLEELKMNGTNEDVNKFKIQIKKVVNKLQEIEQVLKDR